jgi:hypothetical protein
MMMFQWMCGRDSTTRCTKEDEVERDEVIMVSTPISDGLKEVENFSDGIPHLLGRQNTPFFGSKPHAAKASNSLGLKLQCSPAQKLDDDFDGIALSAASLPLFEVKAKCAATGASGSDCDTASVASSDNASDNASSQGSSRFQLQLHERLLKPAKAIHGHSHAWPEGHRERR